MKTRNLLILLITALLLVGLAYYRAADERRRAATRPTPGQKVFPDLDINRVATVIVTDYHGGATVRRGAERWQVAERYGYAADFQRLRNLLTTLADLSIGRALATDADLRRELNLLQPDEAGPGEPAGLQIELLDDRDQRLAALTLGQEFHRDFDPMQEDMPFQWRGAEGRYVRTHQDQVVLVSERFAGASADPDAWLDRRFLDIPSHSLTGLEWSLNDITLARISRSHPGDAWDLRDIPDGQMLDGEAIREFTTALANLNFAGIADPATDPADLNLTDEAVQLTIRSDDGREYQLTVGARIAAPDPPRHAMRVAAAYALPQATGNNGAPSPSAEALTERVHRHAVDVRNINERFATWIYLIDDQTATMLRSPADTWLIQKNDAAEKPHGNLNAQ